MNRASLWVFAFANVLLYASLLPLWEGFDEPFHYGYVQYLWTQRTLPVTGQAKLSQEIWESLHSAPGSYLVHRNLPFVRTFADWFRAGGPPMETSGDKHVLADEALNYEAQQAPLAYLLLAVPDALLSPLPLSIRIWLLRILCGALGIGFFLAALMRLTSQPAVWFCGLAIQMLYASTVHVSNDWLAIPIAAWLVVAAVEDRPWLTSVLITAGLLTKAYFLAFVPLAIWACRRQPVALIVLLAAVPWYVRNCLLFGNIAGVFITTPKMPMSDAFATMNWLDWIQYVLHAGLWTGNNSFTSFSRLTLDALLVLTAIGILLCRPVRWISVAAVAAMAAVLAYSTVILRAYTGGETAGTGIWYVPAIYAPLLSLVDWRGWLARLAVAVSAYILLATYWVKLLPMYGGFTGERGTLPAVVNWYRDGLHVPAYLASAWLVYTLAVLTTAAALWTMIVVLRSCEPFSFSHSPLWFWRSNARR